MTHPHRAPCPLCGAPSPARFRAGDHAVHRCGACDFEFVDPLPSAAEIARVYERGYFTGGGAGYEDYFGAERAASDAKARDRVAKLFALGARPGGRVLDVGCADGRFLLEARAGGLMVRGVEVSPEARAALPPELAGAVDGSLAQAAAHGPYDAVTLWDVLEHLPDPLGALRGVRAVLAPGALVGVVVPVIDNANARWWPSSWDQYKPPEHLWYFSRRALRATLERELGASVVLERSAWRREARLLDVAGARAKGPLARAARSAERLAWRALAAAGAVARERLDDSVIMFARAGGAAA